jgi:inositol-phosphate transport system substrate-binding protein
MKYIKARSRIAASVFISLIVVLGLSLSQVMAKNITIQVWAGGSNVNDSYRVDAIVMAANILEREAAIRGEKLNITVETKYDFDGWGGFKQAVTLAAEANKAPHIVVTGHEDIAPWSQSGLIRPIENYLDFDSWPLNDLFENLVEISSFEGVIYGVPQDAESRPFFAWIPHLKAIGYSSADIRALPGKIERGQYTLYDVLDDAKKIQDAGLVKPGYGWYPRVSKGGDYWQFYLSFGGEMLDAKSGKLVFERNAMKKFYAFFAKAVEMGVTRKNHIGTPWDQWYSEVASGKAGLWHGGTWHYARYTGKEGLKDFFGNIVFSLIPAGDKDGRANTITHPLVYLVTNRGSEEDASIAAQLVAIASEPRINTLHAIKSAHLGITKSQKDVPLYANDRWASEATKRLLPFASAQPNHTGLSPYFDAMWKGLEAAWTGQKSSDEAVSDVESELRASLGSDIIIR